MKYFNWLWLIVLILGGCSQANVRGNETIREYNITVNNSDQSTLTMTMPLSVDAIATESLSQTTDNDPATETDVPFSLAGQGATASTSGEDSEQTVTKPKSDYTVTPAPVVVTPVVTPTPVEPAPVVTPVDPTKPISPVEPTDPDMHGFTHSSTIQNTGEKMSYRTGGEASVEQDKFVFTGKYGPDYGSNLLVVWSDGKELTVPNTSSMAMMDSSGGYRKFQPGGKHSHNNPDIPFMEVYAARYTHPASVTVFYNGVGEPETPPVVDPPSDTMPSLSDITWLHTDVSGWPETAKLSAVSTTSSTISLPYDKAKVWPGVTADDTILNANPWIIVQHTDGKWYAATWEWLRPGQVTKSKSAVAGDHIKQPPLQNFKPVVGETYYFFVSGLARGSERNVQERSNVVAYKWE